MTNAMVQAIDKHASKLNDAQQSEEIRLYKLRWREYKLDEAARKLQSRFRGRKARMGEIGVKVKKAVKKVREF
jgi:hypothetical protein